MSIKKRGQFTMFVILGFVLLVIAIFTMFLVSVVQDSNFNNQAKRAVDDYIDASAINYYVYSCMDSSVNDAILEISKQGGVYYDDDGGNYEKTVPGETHIRLKHDFGIGEEEVNVSYSVRGDYAPNGLFLDPPEYPFPNTKLSDLSNKYAYDFRFFLRPVRESGVFGFNNLSRLCYNSENFQSNSNIISPCGEDASSAEVTTIESELAKMIINKMNNCTDFSIFQDEEAHNITIIEEPSSEIVYNSETLSVKFTYPFEIKLRNREPVIVQRDFEYSSDLRFTSLHNYFLKLVKKEVQDPFFNLTIDYAGVEGYDPDYYNVSIINNDSKEFQDCTQCDWSRDFILMVQDNSSEAKGQYLTLMSAFQNRRPALDYIHETDENAIIDVVGIDGEIINMSPLGIDPEDGNLTYEYIGWKETYDEFYDYSRIINGELCSNPPDFSTFENCVVPLSNNPDLKKWTESQEYVDTKKDASYIPDEDDVGIHKLTIRITDNAKKNDWQIVKLLVFDLPTFSISLTTPYLLMPEDLASVEDPFSLDSSGSEPPIVPGTEIGSVIWKINKKNGVIFTKVFEKALPFNSDPPVPNPDNIVNVPKIEDIQTIHTKELVSPGEYEIILVLNIVSQLLGNDPVPFQESKNVQVENCIPYRSNDYSYPYNSNANPFLSNHTCCIGDIANTPSIGEWKVADDSVVCFNDEWYGEKNKLKTKSNELLKDDKFALYDKYTSKLDETPGVSGDKNDIYKLGFERSCDGSRGNICAGPADYVLDRVDSCTNAPTGQEETCSGPSPDISNNGMSCVDYSTGKTFESIFGVGNGICQKTPACSDKNGVYADNGPMNCVAQCDGQGSCTIPTNCYCSTTFCNAQCDDLTDVKRNGDICNYGCDTSNTCDFKQQKTLPCDNNVCYNDNFNGEKGCFSKVKCNPSGGSYDFDLCTDRGSTLTENGEVYCFYGPVDVVDVCNPYSGECKYSSVAKSSAPSCPVEQHLSCNPTNGWICVI